MASSQNLTPGHHPTSLLQKNFLSQLPARTARKTTPKPDANEGVQNCQQNPHGKNRKLASAGGTSHPKRRRSRKRRRSSKLLPKAPTASSRYLSSLVKLPRPALNSGEHHFQLLPGDLFPRAAIDESFRPIGLARHSFLLPASFNILIPGF